MAEKYVAFISYAHQDKAWVRVLQQNLERCLAAAGRLGKIYLDEVDLASGHSWVGQLQAGLDRSEQLVLVATPEALASPRVADEWQSFVANCEDWHDGRLHIAHLFDTPLPRILGQIHSVDFRQAEEDQYRRELQRLVAGLLGQPNGRNPPALPAGIEIPSSPTGRLDPALRSRLVCWLAQVLAKEETRIKVADRLSIKPERLEGQGSWACAASAALVWTSGHEEPITAALRFIDILQEVLDGDKAERLEEIAPLRSELAIRLAESPDQNLLSTWLDCIARDHKHLVPLQEHIALTLLDRVYVQLAVRPSLRWVGDLAASVQFDQTSTLRNLLALDRRKHPWVTGRWVVLGDPGAGKTTLLRHLAATLARREDRPCVLFESLPRLLQGHTSPLDHAIHRLERAGHPAQGLAKIFERAMRNGRLFLLLDGLDEVPKEAREEAEQLLRDLVVRWPKAQFVVASRHIGYRSLGDFLRVDLLPLDRDLRRELLARWFGRMTGTPDEAQADSALRILDAPELQDMAGNPLYLTLMALLFEQGIAPDRNRTHLYDQVFDLLFEGKHRPGAKPMERKEIVRALLRRLAFGMTEDDRDSEPAAALEERLYRSEMDALREKLERVDRWRGRLRHFLDELAEKTGILGPHDGPDADWRFWHRTFREALTAEGLQEQFQEHEGRTMVLARAKALISEEDLSRWAEPFALLAGRIPNPADLVKALVKENRLLGLRALATAQNLRVETFHEILALSDKAEERSDVYGRLLELVGEPRRTLALIDQLRKGTRNGNDLFFLNSAAREIGRLSPEHAGGVTTLLANFFEHIPRPPEELFQWIETPLDGRVPFWRDIPAGSFWMGAQKDEGSNAEHPRHLVKITSSFRCGTTPITNAQYAAFDPDHKSFASGVPPEVLRYFPVESVTWFEALSFCQWLSHSFHWAHDIRLPTEEEWEYACRAHNPFRYWKGNNEEYLAKVGWYARNSDGRAHRVGEKPPNPWGLYDVHGNVWEWTLNPWTDSYYDTLREDGRRFNPSVVEYDMSREDGRNFNPSGVEYDTSRKDERNFNPSGVEFPTTKLLRSWCVTRGGSSWAEAYQARAANRNSRNPWSSGKDLGFRVVIPAAPEPLQ